MDEYKFRDLRFTEEDRRKEVKIGKDRFVIKAIFPSDNRVIARWIVAYQGGQPHNAFSPSDIARFDRDATITAMLVEWPEWWQGTDQCIHEETLDLLWKAINDWTREVQAKLKKNQLPTRGATSAVSA